MSVTTRSAWKRGDGDGVGERSKEVERLGDSKDDCKDVLSELSKEGDSKYSFKRTRSGTHQQHRGGDHEVVAVKKPSLTKRQSSTPKPNPKKVKAQTSSSQSPSSRSKRRPHASINYEEGNHLLKEEEKGHSGRKGVFRMSDAQPQNWQLIYNNIETMRERRDAPVDSMGCEVLADTSAPPHVQRYHVLVALMLSSQTKDAMTSKAVKRLQSSLPGGLTIESVRTATTTQIEEYIYGVGFWRRKATYLKKTADILADKFDGDIPKDIKGLVSLPGVGMKMATIAMSVANKEVSGIGVDTHVHRIANQLKWVRKPTTQPEQTRIALEEWVPRSLWGEVNVLLVGFGQQLCTPRDPKCVLCLNNRICPSSSYRVPRVAKSGKKKGKKEEEEEEEEDMSKSSKGNNKQRISLNHKRGSDTFTMKTEENGQQQTKEEVKEEEEP
eukprot:m.16438 g.16438  ORF g.16438 m.16438 type:complete len:440 (+) comp4617_c0_seq1:116-1435(+)